MSLIEFDEAGSITQGTAIRVCFLLLFITILLLIIVSTLYQEFGEAGLDAFSIAISSVLTISLVSLYFMQARISNRQFEMMKQSNRANISIANPIFVDDDLLRFNISNLSDAPVYSLYLKTDLTTDSNHSLEPRYYQMRPEEEGGDRLGPLTSSLERYGKVGSMVPLDEYLGTGKHEWDSSPKNFSQVTEWLVSEGVEQIKVEISIQVSDPVGKYSMDIFSSELDLEEGSTFEETFDATLGGPITRKGLHDSVTSL